jgi:hypothetical protein
MAKGHDAAYLVSIERMMQQLNGKIQLFYGKPMIDRDAFSLLVLVEKFHATHVSHNNVPGF